MTTAESQARIDELKSRWAEDPASRVFVQLAEEYRRNGDLPEAISVLEQGLSTQPNYVTAQVTLGRCHLASGNAQEAVEILSRVMEQAPSHPLAGKLLVEAHLETGELAEAKRRLDLYRMMADGDPEIDQLEDRLRRARENRAQSARNEDSGIGAAGAERAAGDAEQGSDDVFDLDSVELSLPEEETAGTSAEHEPRETGSEPEPFDLPAPRSGPLEAPDEPFRLDPAPPARTEHASVTHPPKDEPFGDLSGGEAPWNRSRLEGDIFGLSESAATPAGAVEAKDAEAEQRESEPEAAPGQEREAEEATVTLGRLYMSQGHEDEAARIFRSILERDPGNEISRNALAELETKKAAGSGAEPVEADSVEADSVETETARSAAGITARKISKLEDYLERLRRAAG